MINPEHRYETVCGWEAVPLERCADGKWRVAYRNLTDWCIRLYNDDGVHPDFLGLTLIDKGPRCLGVTVPDDVWREVDELDDNGFFRVSAFIRTLRPSPVRTRVTHEGVKCEVWRDVEGNLRIEEVK